MSHHSRVNRHPAGARPILANPLVLGRSLPKVYYMGSRPDAPRPVEQAAEALAAIVRSSPDAILTVGLDGRVLTWNRGAERLYGFPPEYAIGRTFPDLFPDDGAADAAWAVDVIKTGQPMENVEVVRKWPDGSLRTLAVTMSPIFDADGNVEAIASIIGDITPLKQAEQRLAASLIALRESTLHDRLTGIGSRDMLMQYLASLGPETHDIAVLLVDLDDFQYFNQTFGHGTGDDVLRAFVDVLRELVESDDVVARTGGDEFVIVSHGKGSGRGRQLAQAITARLARPVSVEGRGGPVPLGAAQVSLSAGIGVSTVAEVRSGLADFLLRRADIAQYEAKAAGHGIWRCYDDDMEAGFAARTQLEERLRHAIRVGDQLRLVYQPICQTGSGVITEVEALLRWDDPERGAISPADFIPVAEQSGLIVGLGEWVLRQACAAIATLNADGASVRLNVNVSPRQLADPGFADAVLAALAESGLVAGDLVLEITESAIVGSGETLVAELQRLREIGVGLAVDDFGTGHSSLGRLHSLPFTSLKVDKSLIDGLGEGRGGDIIVDAVVGMAHALGLTVVAEGVEEMHQLARLRDLKCDLIQGFVLHRPLPFGDLKERLEEASVRVP